MGTNVNVFPGATPRQRRVATGVITGPGQRLILDISKENFQKEHMLLFNLSMANVGAPTAVDISRMGKLVQSVVLRVAGPQGGELYNCSGLLAHLLTATQENSPSAITPLAAPQTVQFGLELHHENDAALRSLMTALNGDKATGITMEITMGALADARSIAGGPYVAAAAMTTMTGTVDVIVSEVATRNLLGVAGVAIGRHFAREKLGAIAGAGQVTTLLEIGNRTRGLLISVEAATGVGSDALVSNLALQIGGETFLDVSWFAARMKSCVDSNVNGVGLVWIPFSQENEQGFLDLKNVNQAHLVSTFTGAGQIRVLQDYSEGLIPQG